MQGRKNKRQRCQHRALFPHGPLDRRIRRTVGGMVAVAVIAAFIVQGCRGQLNFTKFSSPSSGTGFCLVIGSRAFSDTLLVTGANAGPTPLLPDPSRPGFLLKNTMLNAVQDAGGSTPSTPASAASVDNIPWARDLPTNVCGVKAADVTTGKEARTRAGGRSLGNADSRTAPDLDRLLDAIALVESNNRANAVGDGDTAVGAYQIRPIFLRDVNRILGCDRYELDDRWDPVKSRQMAVVYMNHYGSGRMLLDMARQFNGGPRGHLKRSTLTYAGKIQAILN